jgi:protein O-mannosyl-transferase
MVRAESRERRRARSLTLVALLAALPYVNSISGQFTFDDAAVVRDNPNVMQLDAPLGPLLLGLRPPLIWYRPLTMLSYRLNAWAGRSPFGFHLVNVFLHVLVSLLVFELAALWTGHGLAAFATAALFAVHPIHTEAVSSVVGRAELLAALFVFASLLAAARIRARGSCGWIAASMAWLLLGLFAKESAVASIPLTAVVCRRPGQELAWRRVAGIAVLLLCASLPYLYLRKLVVGAVTLPALPDFLSNPAAYSPWPVRLATALVVVSQYLSQLLLPVRLYADYSFDHVPVVLSPTDPRLLAALAGLGTIGVVLLIRRRKEPVLVDASIFFILSLALTSNALFTIGTIRADRLLYLPSFGFCLALGWLVAQWARVRYPLAAAVLVLTLGVLSLRTVLRNQDWHDDCALFLSAIRAGTGSAKSYLNAGVCFQEAGDFDLAAAHFRRALEIYPQYRDAAFGIGYTYERKGNDALALKWYRRTMDMPGGYAKASLNTGWVLYRRGDAAGAETAFRSGLQIEPESPDILVGLAFARLVQNDRESAAALIRRAMPLATGNPELVKLVRQATDVLERGETRIAEPWESPGSDP